LHWTELTFLIDKSLFKDDINDDKIPFSSDNTEAQPATEAALPSSKGAN
jgi:hypothetical protein